MDGWKTYFENTRDKPPRPLLVEALSYVADKGTALDLGASALNDSRYLLDVAFRHVTAVDIEPVAAEIAATFPPERFSYAISSFDDFAFVPKTYDLINAQYALPFASPGSFRRLMDSIRRSLVPGGVLAAQFFGDRDSWNTPGKGMTFVTRVELDRLLESFEVLVMREEEKDDGTAISKTPKHWHVFHVIARKPQAASAVRDQAGNH